MPLKKFFKGKRKIGLSEPISRSLPTNTSGILTNEFPPLASRAKSPSDVLDFVGHPHSILAVINDDLPEPPPPPVYNYMQQPLKQPVTAIPGPRRPSFHNYSYDDDQERKRAAATPPTLVMPQPIMAVPPTRDTVLRSSSKDKTLVSAQVEGATVDEEQQQDNTSSSNRCSSATLQGLYEQLESYRLEHKEWLRREREHEQIEEWMVMKLYDVQTQLDQLTAHVDSQHQKIFDNEEDDDDDDYDDGLSSGYASEEEEEEEEDHQHEQEGSSIDRWRYYYHPVHHPRPPIRYRRHHHHHQEQQQQQRPWSAAMLRNTYYPHAHHRPRHPLPLPIPPPLMPPQLPPYPRYRYEDSWPPVRRQKPLDDGLGSVRKNSIRRSWSTGRFPK